MNTNMGMRLRNPIKDTAITLSDSTKQAAVIHTKEDLKVDDGIDESDLWLVKYDELA